MKYLLILTILLFISSAQAKSEEVVEFSTPSLICVNYLGRSNISISCVSKVSIEKDQAQLKLLQMQISDLEMDRVKKANKRVYGSGGGGGSK